jgi:H+-translocating NAD(P) transhydrogenase subunit alpha
MPDRLSTRLGRTRLCVALLLFLTLGLFLFAAIGERHAAAEAPSPSSLAQQGGAEARGPADAEPAAAPQKPAAMDMSTLLASLYILVLAGFVGFEVIGGVSPLLHTPLMSITNAISAISVVGALVVAGSAEYGDTLSRLLGFAAVAAAMTNVVGGFMITDRMLRLFKSKGVRA